MIKPAHVHWTDDQWKAIVAEGSDILVAAAAGSGKTAVLVERIIQKLIGPNPIDVDRLLVVTFTNASAQEMKTRIAEALDKELAKQPHSQHLRKQLNLLGRASISTLHSFCLQVIRNYYYMIDVDPGFRIGSQAEIELLKEEVLHDLLEEEYGLEGNEPFFDLVERYTSDRSDHDLQDMILAFHREATSHPNPKGWLQHIRDLYKEANHIDELPYTSYLLACIQLQLRGLRAHLEKAIELTQWPGGPLPREAVFRNDIRQIDMLLAASSWTEMDEAIKSVKWETLPRIKRADYEEELLQRTDQLRKKVKDDIAKMAEDWFSRSPEAYMRDLKEMAPIIAKLTDLVQTFIARFQQVKRAKSMVDFTDLEHFCLAILQENDAPSAVAMHYRELFAEVLVDEYQDVNFVQESILRLVTKETESAGNLFMVGDIKQSIYRFRLAEPGLFLGKYKRFTHEGEGGLKIDLAQNFRSRPEVLHGTNFVFKQIMGEAVGEIAYDEDAELKPGAVYPDSSDVDAELLVIQVEAQEEEELENPQLEARLIAQRIRKMISSGYEIYDRKHNSMRPVSYRDFVILLRSMPWAPAMMEEFKLQGIPAYAELTTGYFEATEVNVMLNVLRVIDNPQQDIPLASVLRSPIVGMTDEELATIRIHGKKASFYQVLKSFAYSGEPRELREKTDLFLQALQRWRDFARQHPLTELIASIYRQTGYYDFVGGLPGGKQRQANLRMLQDKARQYEAGDFRGLFRFLRFIERLQERGDDMGAARVANEQEDVVRIMTVHKSKGLEFPVVFVAGMGRRFNTRDLTNRFLLHKDFGFGSQFIDPQKRIKFTTLPYIAIKQKMKMELIAEEMRVLYVALTRAKEKLILIGSVKDAAGAVSKWTETNDHKEWLLPDYVRAQASSYLDWLGPALMRHRAGAEFGDRDRVLAAIDQHEAKWKVEIIPTDALQPFGTETEEDAGLLAALRAHKPVPAKDSDIVERLCWSYSFGDATTYRAKQSVSDLKRQYESNEDSDEVLLSAPRSSIEKRPRFMEKKGLTGAERGTAMHTVMQHVNLHAEITKERVAEQLASMVNRELLTEEQAESVDPEEIVMFFRTNLGQRVKVASHVEREVPFSILLAASETYRDWSAMYEEKVVVQGVIDCMIEEEDGIILIDFKTDKITGKYPRGFEQARKELEKRYEKQLHLYATAIETSLKKQVKEKYLYFFDGHHILALD
ncbi:helicase-exonuclease AddAB subunit AddA [Ectobacillus sp. JY-23]|uniref:helicase-exonuclease AddAB subunit AddA n=1 Tax=Ectobacillus sp. JY-23 TaxID=2933872 RepID=UPI001FF2ED19|nr:helicase-exonuclease AddAB subunit AddA [Ectobacillus sp. JY-23]UOY92084.1 helicase-exonuclease AddAB subunit AddA [Ectobacillus sp. JY-23]